MRRRYELLVDGMPSGKYNLVMSIMRGADELVLDADGGEFPEVAKGSYVRCVTCDAQLPAVGAEGRAQASGRGSRIVIEQGFISSDGSLVVRIG